MGTLYEVLGVATDATQTELRRAYRRLARELHPDLHATDDAPTTRARERRMTAVKAWDTLGDAVLRFEYDVSIGVRARPTTSRGAPPSGAAAGTGAGTTQPRRARRRRAPTADDLLQPPPGFRRQTDDPGGFRLMDTDAAVFNVAAREMRKRRDLLDGGYALVALSGDLQSLRSIDPRLLHRLDCSRQPVDDGQLEVLRGMPSLRELLLSGTEITDAGLEIVATLPALRELNLTHTAVGDAGLEHVGRIESLENLNLFGTGVTDDGLVHLARLTNLDCLDLRETLVRGEGLRILADLADLDIVQLPRGVRWRERRRLERARPGLLVV